MEAAIVEEASLRLLVQRFYAKVRIDPLLGPVFDAAIHDWPDHETHLIDFWSSVMCASGRYKGNPVAVHLRHAAAMTPDRFARWLTLWRQTSDELLPPAHAAAVQAKAERIAESLQLAIQYRRPTGA